MQLSPRLFPVPLEQVAGSKASRLPGRGEATPLTLMTQWPPDMGPAPVGAKRRRKNKELSHEELVALKAERLNKQFEGLVSQPAYLAMDKSSAARLNYADTGALFCQACKCTLSAMGGTGNIHKHLKNDKYVSMTSRCNTHIFNSAEWPSSTGKRSHLESCEQEVHGRRACSWCC